MGVNFTTMLRPRRQRSNDVDTRFHVGSCLKVLPNGHSLSHVFRAHIDGSHAYEAVKLATNQVINRQYSRDLVVLDDYVSGSPSKGSEGSQSDKSNTHNWC